VSVVQQAGWYADPTGRHEWRYWQPGWGDLAADGTTEVTDPLRARWRRYLAFALIAQLVLVPVLGFYYIQQGDKLDARVGVVQQGEQDPPDVSIVYAACPGERITHIALSRAGGKGVLNTVIWSATGDAAADQPIEFGKTPDGMTEKVELAEPVAVHEKLVLLVSTNQLKDPNSLEFTMDDVPTSGAVSYHGTYSDDDAFRTAALDTTPCGAESSGNRRLLVKVMIGEVLLALVGVGLVTLPRYRGPESPYA
jgi:hypothetical protein